MPRDLASKLENQEPPDFGNSATTIFRFPGKSETTATLALLEKLFRLRQPETV
jgi:hypothetical protein